MALDREKKSLEMEPNLPPEPDLSQEGTTEEPQGRSEGSAARSCSSCGNSLTDSEPSPAEG